MSLTSLIADKSSAVALFMNEHFPFTKSVQADYLASAPALEFPPCSANPGTVGTAYDWRVRLLVDLHPDVRLPVVGALRVGRRELAAALVELLLQVGIPVDLGSIGFQPEEATATHMSEMGDEWLSHLAWVLALYTELFRSGAVYPGSPLSRLGKKPTPRDLLALAPDEACADLAILVEATKNTLLPVLAQRAPVTVGPTFAGSALVGGADADLTAGGLLVDVKSTTGGKRSDGTRRCSLGRDVLYQLLGYVLLDWEDVFALESVALYAVRFDYLRCWDLESLTAELRIGKAALSLDQLRREFQRVLSANLPRSAGLASPTAAAIAGSRQSHEEAL